MTAWTHSAFKDAPRQMQQRETALLKRPTSCLCGGPSLYDAKRALHPNVLCLPSAVDAAHYRPQAIAQPVSEGRSDGALNGINEGLPRPRLGFFGVIDERLDRDLVAALADADPTWQIVMVGPVVKIDVADLPARPNLHWFGQQTYERLPHWVAGWDVCLVPFARNEATRFISPTKTLEYMAAEKPVVSTAITDVERLYRQAVEIAHDTDQFISACRRALLETPEHRTRRVQRMRALVSAMSWDSTVERIRAAMQTAAVSTLGRTATTTRNSRPARPAVAIASPKPKSRADEPSSSSDGVAAVAGRG
jgi:glycosyltransferase involved in cell wall biosynthesis